MKTEMTKAERQFEEDWNLWNKAIDYGITRLKDKRFTKLDYLEHMHRVAIEVNIPSTSILEFKQEIRQLNKEVTSEF